jgi:transmembrane sensor
MGKDRFLELLIKDLTGEITVDEQRELIYLRGEAFYDPQEEELLRTFWTNSHKIEYDSYSLFANIKRRIENGESLPEETPYNTIESSHQSTYNESLQAPVFNPIAKMLSALLIACYGFFIFHSYFTYKKELLVKETAKGIRSVFTLNDGTEVRLNSDSRLEYPAKFSDTTREVFLIGEAFFDVSKDHKHPFIIHTKDANIKVLGTTFNVKAYSNEGLTETTLIQGAITVTLTGNIKEQIKLKPSQKLVIKNLHNQNRSMSAENRINASLKQLTYFKPDHSTIVETSWTQNKLTFKNQDFPTLALSMERWYNVDISFESENAKLLNFTGIIEKENINEALKALQLTEKFNYVINDNSIKIY